MSLRANSWNRVKVHRYLYPQVYRPGARLRLTLCERVWDIAYSFKRKRGDTSIVCYWDGLISRWNDFSMKDSKKSVFPVSEICRRTLYLPYIVYSFFCGIDSYFSEGLFQNLKLEPYLTAWQGETSLRGGGICLRVSLSIIRFTRYNQFSHCVMISRWYCLISIILN